MEVYVYMACLDSVGGRKNTGDAVNRQVGRFILYSLSSKHIIEHLHQNREILSLVVCREDNGVFVLGCCSFGHLDGLCVVVRTDSGEK